MNLENLKNLPPWDWPDDVDAALLDVLNNPQSSQPDRLLAAELAGDYTVMNNKLAEALLTIAADENEAEEIREKATLSFGPALETADTMGFDDPDDILISEDIFEKVQQILRKIYEDTAVPKNVRRMALETLVRAPQEWHRDAIQAAYGSDDEAWKLTAVFCMRFEGGFDEQILEELESKNPDIHYQAVHAAGNWEIEGAWTHIVSLVGSDLTEKSLRIAAIEAAGRIRPQDASLLLSELADSDDEDIAEAAMDAIDMADHSSTHDFENEWSDDDEYDEDD